MFRGINAIHIDGKGRLAVPTKYRSALGMDDGASLVVTIDTEETCLLLYPLSEWQIIEENLQRLPSFDAITRRIQRLLIGHATDVKLDGNGRLLLPPLLREYAKLDKRVLMIGQSNKFEVWAESIWEAKRSEWLSDDSTNLKQMPDELKTFNL
ncbi:MAG: cell division/cell wall cluster transcriptional repressor MraZ [Legionellales bacterium RIFCSPHIGHO2_12_FULL_35_11]|nr:MAG: cell division/cell wall cluster transcriptional repressor MraZ [Legionellales bacterium RIFCSPHIGHO2_12_FULL_35_11]